MPFLAALLLAALLRAAAPASRRDLRSAPTRRRRASVGKHSLVDEDDTVGRHASGSETRASVAESRTREPPRALALFDEPAATGTCEINCNCYDNDCGACTTNCNCFDVTDPASGAVIEECYMPRCEANCHCNGVRCSDEVLGKVKKPRPKPRPKPSPKPRPKPRPRPAVTINVGPRRVITEHPLLVLLEGLDPRYYLSDAVREAIVDHIFAELRERLAPPDCDFELRELLYQGELPGRPHALPLLAVVRAPADAADAVPSCLAGAAEKHGQEIADGIKLLEAIALRDLALFASLGLGVDAYDPDQLVNRRTRAPSYAPTPDNSYFSELKPEPELEPEPRAVGELDATVEAVAEVPWWGWGVIALAVFLCYGCYLCCFGLP